MNIDLEKQSRGANYKLLSNIVTPRPIAWITTINKEGVVNLAPFSFFNLIGVAPPIVAFAPGNKDKDTPKDTARNIAESGEFVVHLVDEPLAEMMVATSATRPFGESELEGLSLTTEACEKVKVPRILEAPFALECTEHTTMQIGLNRLVIGEIHHLHAREGLLDEEGNLLGDHYRPVGRMGAPDWYTKTEEQFAIKRPD